jgi:hypothetical protein
MRKQSSNRGKHNQVSPPEKNEIKNSQPDNNSRKDKLACWFYSLAITYYCIQLVDKIGSHISMPANFELSSFVSTSLIDHGLQIITIMLMIFKSKR